MKKFKYDNEVAESNNNYLFTDKRVENEFEKILLKI